MYPAHFLLSFHSLYVQEVKTHLYSKLLLKLGQDFLDIQYNIITMVICKFFFLENQNMLSYTQRFLI